MVKLGQIYPEPELGQNRSSLFKIYNSMRPIIYICKFVGLFPFEFKETKQTELRVKRSDWMYFGIYMSLYTVLSTYSLTVIVSDDKNFTVISKRMVMLECLVMVVLMFFVTTLTFIMRKLIVNSLNQLTQIDNSFRKHNFSIDYRTLLKNNYIIVILTLTSLFVRSVLTLLTVDVDVIEQITMFLSTLIKALSKYQFVAVVLQLQVRFETINSVIRSFYNQPKTKIVLDPIVKNIPDQLYILCRLHYKLGHVLRMVNTAFACQLLGSIAVTLFDILFQAYYLYYVLSGKAASVNFVMVACPVVWLIDEILEVYWLVYACASTCDNANETPTILHELRNNYFDIELESHIQMYSLQMLHQKVQFSALGFFVIDFTLIYSIVGAVTTYLVIFIQFDQSASAKENIDGNITIGGLSN